MPRDAATGMLALLAAGGHVDRPFLFGLLGAHIKQAAIGAEHGVLGVLAVHGDARQLAVLGFLPCGDARQLAAAGSVEQHHAVVVLDGHRQRRRPTG